MEGMLAMAVILLLAITLVFVSATLVLARRYMSLRGRIPVIIQSAVEQSRAVTRGKVTEQIVPYLPEFRFDPKDARFIGSPIDLVVFDGLSEGEVKSVVFVEVKTGRSALTSRERRVRDAILDGRVTWEELRPSA